jgi:CrcB protein
VTAALLVCIGAAVGAPARYLLDLGVQSLHRTVFPFGTLTVNIAGSLALGMLVGLGTPPAGTTYLALGTGFCGAFTTYSTFSYEAVRLVERGAWRHAVVNALVSVGGALVAASAGIAVGSWIS